MTLPAILGMHGFDVHASATVGEALSEIQSQVFDVLISDLNIGQPGDGFTLVSAMRRLQPHAVTLIITGFPAFETALQAIRAQVDDYVVKPADIAGLVQSIEEKLKARRPNHLLKLKRVAVILEENAAEVGKDWLHAVKSDQEISAVPASDRERVDHVLQLLDELVKGLKSESTGLTANQLKAATAHGMNRRCQNYSIPMILEEARILRNVVYQCLQRNLLAVDVSNLIPDMVEVGDSLDRGIRESVRAYLGSNLTPTEPRNLKQIKRKKAA